MSSTTFTLDIGEQYLKVVDAEMSGGSLVAHSAALTDVEFNPYATTAEDYVKRTSDAIQKLLNDAQIKKRDAHIVIPDSQSYTRVFEMPLLTEKELLSAIRYQADQFIPIPIEKVSMDIFPLKKDKQKGKSLILLVAASVNVIEHATQIATAASLTPISVENETSATLRLLSKIYEKKEQEEEMQVYINFGETSTSLYLYNLKEMMPVQVHNFAIGRSIFYKDIQANLTITPQQIKEAIEKVGFLPVQAPYNLPAIISAPFNEFVDELKRFIISSKEMTSRNISKVFIFGEGSAFAGIDTKLSESLGVPVEICNISSSFKKNSVVDYFVHDWNILLPAVGACLQ
ncbi:pilus assembly protein PilM [Candidatus Woesebacteria bacterium]|nr:pilus assembly protein PilM [Candidatus Woesebacteria bacterium]